MNFLFFFNIQECLKHCTKSYKSHTGLRESPINSLKYTLNQNLQKIFIDLLSHYHVTAFLIIIFLKFFYFLFLSFHLKAIFWSFLESYEAFIKDLLFIFYVFIQTYYMI